MRLLPDTYVAAADVPPDFRLRSLAAYRHVEGRGVLSGYSAAELLGAACAPHSAPAEITVPSGWQRNHQGLLVHRDRLATTEILQLGDVRLTSSLRTAYDLARRLDLIEAVVAVDALANRGRFAPDMLLHFAARYSRSRGNAQIATVLAHADRRSGSPWSHGYA